jgi:hypothetical protein
MRTRFLVPLALLALVLVTAATRLVGIDFLEPQWTEQDSQLVQHLRLERTGNADDESGYDDAYPYVLPYLLRAMPQLVRVEAKPATLEQHIAVCKSLFTETRMFIALLSCLSIPLAYLLARHFVAPRWALYASALCAASLLTHYFSQQARPHAAAAPFMLLAVVAALRLRERPTLANYALAGLAAALGLGVLHNGAAVVLAGLAAHFLRAGERRATDHWKLLVPVALVLLGVRVFYPFFFADAGSAEAAKLESNEVGVTFGRHVVDYEQFTFGGARTMLRTLAHYEPGLLALLALALLAFLGRKRLAVAPAPLSRAALVVLAYIVPYGLVLASFNDTFDRFLISLVPYGAVLAAWGLERVTGSRALPRALRQGAIALAGAALALQAAACAKLSWLRASDDAMEQASAHVAASFDPASTRLFVAPTLELLVARTEESLFNKRGQRRIAYSRWAKYQAHRRENPPPAPYWDVRYFGASAELGFRTADSIAERPDEFLDALGPGIYVMNAGKLTGHPSERAFYDAVARRGELLWRRAPHADGPWRSVGLDFQPMDAAPDVIWRVLGAEVVGPAIEIYRVSAP